MSNKWTDEYREVDMELKESERKRHQGVLTMERLFMDTPILGAFIFVLFMPIKIGKYMYRKLWK